MKNLMDYIIYKISFYEEGSRPFLSPRLVFG
jgi:hypothetical protein